MGYPGSLETPTRMQVLEDRRGYCHDQDRRQSHPTTDTRLHYGPNDDCQHLEGQTRDQDGDNPYKTNQDRKSGEKVVCFQMAPARPSADACR
jgi:hypothetical protein